MSVLEGIKMIEDYRKGGTNNKRFKLFDIFAMAAKISSAQQPDEYTEEEEFEVLELPESDVVIVCTIQFICFCSSSLDFFT